MYLFFSNVAATTEFYTLSLHDALPISIGELDDRQRDIFVVDVAFDGGHQCADRRKDRKSTRLNSSHRCISYAVFCLKKKKNKLKQIINHEAIHFMTEHTRHKDELAVVA